MYESSRQLIIRYNRRKIIGLHSMEAKLYKKSRIAFRTNSKVALLNFAVDSTEKSSYSFVLSLAEFLSTLKGLTPPGFVLPAKKKPASDAKQTPTEPAFFEPWCEYLFTLICDRNVAKNGEEIILIGKVDEQTFKVIETMDVFEIKASAFSLQKKLASLEAINLLGDRIHHTLETKNRIAIINFSTSTLNQDKMKPKFNIEGLLTGIFYHPGDSWRSYRVLKNELPKVEELAQYSTVILSGSSYSVNNMVPQIENFKDILTQALNINKKLKVLGICFGHQLIARSKEIQVVSRTLNKGLQNIIFSVQNEDSTEYLNDFFKSQLRYLRLYKYHNDHVTSTPEQFNKFGESSKCNIESFISKDKRIFSFQFHPEYTEEYIHRLEQRLNTYFKYEQPAQRAKQRDDFHHKSVEIIRKTMRNFLDWNIQL